MAENSRGLSTYLLLAGLIITWGASWPIMKIGLVVITPLWLVVIRLIIATIALFLVCLLTHNIKLPRKADWPLLLIIGIFQISFFVLAITIGLQYIGAGRAAVIAYTTPLWVTPMAVLSGRESLTRARIIGLIMGFIGVIILINPWQIDWHDHATIIGDGLLLSAALSWAIALLYTRYATWHSTPLQLIPWQMLIGLLPLLLITIYCEPFPTTWTLSAVIAIVFLGLFATGFGFWAMVVVGRRLSVITTALWLLLVPIVGIVLAQLLINEHPDLTLIVAGGFILIGLACMTLGQWHQQKHLAIAKPTFQREIEVKLAITSAHISALLAHPLIKQQAVGEASTKRLITTYYDTLQFDLKKYGVSLRVRYDGEHYVQCLKKKTINKKGLHCRDEWEATLTDASPNFNIVPDKELRSLLLTSTLGELVQPIFTTDFTRQCQQLQFADGTQCELAIDQGIIAVANLSEPLSEIEIELQSGNESTLMTVAKQLMTDLGLTFESRSKASRGYVLRQQL